MSGGAGARVMTAFHQSTRRFASEALIGPAAERTVSRESRSQRY